VSSDVAATIGRVMERPKQRGQSLAEYALIVSLIVIVALVALTFFGTQINDILSIIADTIDG
jgi:Flp pilus assembly pilin Flp